jgi:sterol 3beta-glucosyltransferase
MRVFVLALGTRGDVELFLALARALRSRGHAVVLGTSPWWARRAREAGVEMVPVGSGTLEDQLAVLHGLAALSDRRERTRRWAARWLVPQLDAFRRVAGDVAGGCDYFVSNLKLSLRRGERVLPGASVTYDPPDRLSDLARFGAAAHGDTLLDLVALNRELVDPEGRWGPAQRFTGFWHDPSAPRAPAPADLAAFLADGPPAVAVTLGSMGTFDVERLLGAVAEGLRRAGSRGVVVGGLSRLPEANPWAPRIHLVPEVDYDWVFPRVSCVVHHGGCGTLAAVLRAGRPSILLPQVSCQDRFGEILGRAGLVTGVLETEGLDPAALALALERAGSDPAVQERAHAWQAIVTAERGVETAARWIEEHAQHP